MLTLTRRAGQALLLGPDVEIRVVRIQGDRVVLGIAAPKYLPVVRAELVTAVRDETDASAHTRTTLIGLVSAARGSSPDRAGHQGFSLPGLGRGSDPEPSA